LRCFPVPAGSIALWWLGQASFLIKTPGGQLAALDPYLSNSCKALGAQAGFNMDRLVPPPIPASELAGIDAYLMTHSHQDHLDPETLRPYRQAGGKGPYLAPAQAVDRLIELGVPAGEITTVWPSRKLQLGDLHVMATLAIPFAGDDMTHVGYLISVEGGPKIYFTGDTDFHEILAISLADHKPDVLVTVINGAFRNLGPAEATRLAKMLDVRWVVPCHYDLFPDNTLPVQLFRTNLRVVGIDDRLVVLEHGVGRIFRL
jgi:L-ascorbate 6-phosphate lactonase